jgi:RecA-family ATPase
MHGGDYHGDANSVHTLAVAALRYAARGWHVLPCDPESKRPLIMHGLHAASIDTAQIEAWWQQWPYAMIGVRTGCESGIIVLDVDVDPATGVDGFAAITELEKRHGMLPDTLRATTPRGGEHLYFKWHDGVHNNTGKLGDHVDVRAKDGYVIVPPSMRSDRKAYSWREDALPEPAEAPAWLIELLTTPEPPIPTTAPTPRSNGNGDAYARAALDAECTAVASTAPGKRNHQLNKSAFSLGQLVGGGVLTEGEVKSYLHDAADACGLTKDDGRDSVKATIESGLSAGLKQPRTVPEHTAHTSPIKPETLAALAAIGRQPPPQHSKDKDNAPPPPPLPFLNVTEWQTVTPPPRAWVVLDRVPLNNVTLLSGESAVGKTILGLQLCVATVLARDWLKRLPELGPVIAICCEDDDGELHRRLDHIVRHYEASYADLAELKLISLAGKDALLATPRRDGLLEPTKLFARVLEAARDIRPKLIMLDNSADLYGGNENDRAQVRQFITMLRGLAMISSGGVLLSSHPSLTGISSGSGLSGSTAWNASVRARLYLKRATTAKDEEPDPDLRILEVMKNNYGPAGETITLRWNDGLFLPVAQPGSLEMLAREQKADELFLKLLDRWNSQGRNVSDRKTANAYAPNRFIEEPEAKADKISKHELADAMERLFRAGKIHVVSYGLPSKGWTRIERK